MASCVAAVCIFCLIFVRMILPSEGATQSLSISFDLLSANTTQLNNYGEMGTCYVAYLAQDKSYDLPSAGILFIPTSSNSSFILSVVVYTGFLPAGAVIWMANRNTPVSGNFSLVLDQISGNLLLFNGNGVLAWSSNTTRNPTGGVSMELITKPNLTQPVGTLRLFDNHGNETLWQSSDHPTHALMSKQYLQPGMRLTSWTSLSNPSQGMYNLVMEPGGIALYYNAFQGDSQPYWVWSTNPFGVESMGLSSVTHTCDNLTGAFMDPYGSFVLEATSEIAQPNLTSADLCLSNFGQIPELHFSDYGSTEGDANITFLTLQYDGNVVASRLGTYAEIFSVYDLFGNNRCKLPNYCGPYGICTPPSNCECPSSSNGSFPLIFPSKNPSQGCPPAHNLTCGHNQSTASQTSQSQQRFETLIGVDYFPNDYLPTKNFSTQDACKAACLRNCSCLAAFWHEHTSSCFHVDGMGSLITAENSSYLGFLKGESVPDSQVSPAAASASPSSAPVVVAGVVSGALGLLICLCMLASFMQHRRSRRLKADPQSEEEDPFWNWQPGLPNRYSYKELHSITNGFTEKMGKGGFGTVYAGILQDGSRVAVKRLESFRQGKKEFKAEVVILGGVHHYNLVSLLGFCAEGSHRLLVYEYMAKGSLDQWLFSTETTLSLPWQHRFKIALGAARGLAYLHHHCKDKIIHLDIKPQNILLDDDFVAKVSDFGLSTLMARDESHVITTMRGTPGYLAPEWLTEGSAISEKCDVFSFGKLLMEILGGRRNLEPSLAETEKFYFPAWLYDQMTRATDAELAKRELVRLAGAETAEEIKEASLLMNIAFLCVVEDPHMRPSMEAVVHMLEGHAPEVEHLQVSDYSQGLHFALRMPQPKIEEACAPKSCLGTSQGGVATYVDISAR